MKKFFSTTIALLFGMSVFAEDYSLYYDSAEGAKNVELSSLANLQKLTFENGNVILTFKNGTTKSTEISSVKRLFFSTPEAVGVKDVMTDAEVAGKGEVYDLTGRKVCADIKSVKLPKGLYIIDGRKVAVK